VNGPFIRVDEDTYINLGLATQVTVEKEDGVLEARVIFAGQREAQTWRGKPAERIAVALDPAAYGTREDRDYAEFVGRGGEISRAAWDDLRGRLRGLNDALGDCPSSHDPRRERWDRMAAQISVIEAALLL
jgi:hypothetical protein